MFGCCCNREDYKYKYVMARARGVAVVEFDFTSSKATTSSFSTWTAVRFTLPNFALQGWRKYRKITLVFSAGGGEVATRVLEVSSILGDGTSADLPTITTTYSSTSGNWLADWNANDNDSIFAKIYQTAWSIDWDAGTETYTVAQTGSTNSLVVTCEGLVRDEEVWEELQTQMDSIDYATIDLPTPTIIPTIGGVEYGVPDSGTTGMSGSGFGFQITRRSTVPASHATVNAYAARIIERTISGKCFYLGECSFGAGCQQTSNLNASGYATDWLLEPVTPGNLTVPASTDFELEDDVADVYTLSSVESGPGGSGTAAYAPSVSSESGTLQHAARLVIPYSGAKLSEATPEGGYENRFFYYGAQLHVESAEQEGCEEEI